MHEIGTLQVFQSKSGQPSERAVLSNLIKNHFANTQNEIKILEAGCGLSWELNLRGLDYFLTGLDISEKALLKRHDEQKDLDEIIVGDLRTIKLEEHEYGVVFCSSVLEHIDGAKEVLDKFFETLKQRGILVIRFPDRDAIFGFITRSTPFWFHVLFYRYVRRSPNAGKPPHGPFPVYYDKILCRHGIHEYCRRHGYKIIFERGREFPFGYNFGRLYPLIERSFKLCEAMSLRKLSAGHSGLTYVIEKPE